MKAGKGLMMLQTQGGDPCRASDAMWAPTHINSATAIRFKTETIAHT